MEFQDKNQHWISMLEASKLCAYSQEYLSLLARRGKIFSKKLGRNWYTTREAIDNYLKTQSVFVSLPKNIFGRLTSQATFTSSLTPEEPEKGEPIKHEEHSKIFEEFERLNPALLEKSGASPQTPAVVQPEISPVQKENTEDPVLKKLDRLSGSLELFADRVTRKLEQPAPEPLTQEQKEFFEDGLSSFGYRFKIFDRYARSMMRNPIRLMVIMVTAVVAIFIIAGGFSFGQIDNVVQQIKKTFKDADTVQGHFPGTHANEVLVLGKDGDLSIFGHIETQGQLRSHVPDGVAPITVDSMTLVDNLNANYLDGLASKDFTLAFVTKNGNLTYEDVKLEGNVEVGKALAVGDTLTVKGATKLMDSLQVYGGLGVFGDAVFGKDITVTNGNLVLKKGTITINNTSLIKNLNAEYLDGMKKQDINLDFVTSNGATTGNGITIGGLEVNGQSDFRAPGFFHKGVWGSTGSFGTLGVAGDVSIGNQDKSQDSHFSVFSKYFRVDSSGNVSISGTLGASNTTVSDLIVNGKVKSDLIPSGSFDLGSNSNRWDDVFATNLNLSGAFTASGSVNFDGTSSSSFRINTDNATVDREDSYLAFERGTTTPNATLKWNSTAKRFEFNEPVFISSSSLTTFSVSGGPASISNTLYVQNTGSVGIGTTAPGSLLDTRLSGTTVGTIQQFGNVTNGVYGSIGISSATGSPLQVFGGGGGDLVLGANNTETVRIKSGGNVGIGKTAPLTTLDVHGTASASAYVGIGGINLTGTGSSSFAGSLDISKGLRAGANTAFTVQANASANSLFVANSGNVGIGTTGPGAKLDVVGRGLFVNSEVQGTASASYGLFGTLQVGGFASVSYNRIGTATTAHANYINANNDLLVSGDLEVVGTGSFDSSVTLGTTTTDSLIVNSNIKSSLIPFTNAFNLGSTTNHWGTLYVDTANISVLNAPTASISGTTAADFLINSDNVSNDAENESVTFKRGIPTINAALQWDSTNKQFNFNFPILVQTVDLPEPTRDFTNLTLKAAFDQVGHNYFNINNYSGSQLLAVGPGGWLAASGSFQAGGASVATVSYSRFGTGTTTHGLSAASDVLVTGKLEIQGNTYFNTNSIANFAGIASASRFYAQSGTAASPSFAFATDQDTGLYNPAQETLGFSTFGAERVRIDSSGNVGIGTTSIDAKLEVAGTASISQSTYLATVSGNVGIGTTAPGNKLSVYGAIEFPADATGTFIGTTTGIYQKTLNQFNIVTAGGDRVSVDSSGNVGIGLTTQGNRFEIKTAADADGIMMRESYGGSSALFSVLQNTGDGSGAILKLYDGAGGLAADTKINIDSGTGATYFNASGNVGIGTTSPSGKLDIVGDLAGNTNPLFRVASTSELFRIQENGNVGIGTTGPTSLLTINGRSETQGTASASYLLTGNTLQVGGFASAAYSRFGISTTGHTNYISASNDLLISGDLEVDGSISAQFASVSQMFIANNAASASAFFRGNGSGGTNQSNFSIGVGNGLERFNIFNNDNSPIVTIASTGNVGIGTTGPSGKLDIVGDLAGNTNPLFRVASTSELFRIQENGNVGIGTTGPGSRLEVYNTASTDLATQLAVWQPNVANGSRAGRISFGLSDATGKGGHISLAPNATANLGAIRIGLSGYDDLVTIQGTGNVGIGTTGPGMPLHVVNTAGTNNIAEFISASTAENNIFVGNSTSAATVVGYYATAPAYAYLLLAGSTRGTQSLNINAAGNVGIGTTGPGYKFDVNGAMRAVLNIRSGQDGQTSVGNENDPAITATGYTNAGVYFANSGVGLGSGTGKMLFLNSSGNVGIGTTGPGATLEVKSVPSEGEVQVRATSNSGTNVLYGGYQARTSGGAVTYLTTGDASYTPATYYAKAAWGTLAGSTDIGLRFGTNGVGDRMVIDTTGNVGIGTTGPTHQLELSTDSASKLTTNTWTIFSDARIKKDINTFTDGLDTILKIRPVTYQYNGLGATGSDTTSTHIGVIAQELELVAPYMVETGAGTIGGVAVNDFKSYQGMALPFILVNAVKELNSKFNALAGQFGALNGVLSGSVALESQCVTGDTRLRRRRRRARPAADFEPALGSNDLSQYNYDEVCIKDIEVGDEVLSLNQALGRLEYHPVTAVLFMGTQEVFELTTKSGRKIRTTSNHPYLTQVSKS